MVLLEKMQLHTVNSGNYVTSVHGMVHPDRVMQEHDFLYMLDGTWEIFEDDTCYQMQTDDLLILPANRHHYGKTLCNPGNRHMYLHVAPTPAEQQKTASLVAYPSLLHCAAAPHVREYMQEMISLSWSKNREQKDQLSFFFGLLLCELSKLCTKKTSPMTADPMVEEIIRLIHTTPQTFFTAREIASRYFICERTLNNRFHRICGKTFCAFQMDTKLEMVRHFLRSQPDTTLREAALNYGFYDEFHLSRAFKKKFGMPPSQYRIG